MQLATAIDPCRWLAEWARIRDRELVAAARFDPTGYSRVLVDRTAAAELWLLGWRAGQCTAIHDHAGCETTSIVVRGALLEGRYERVGLESARRVGERAMVERDVEPIDPFGIHRVRAIESAITLHLYAPRYRPGRTFAEAT